MQFSKHAILAMLAFFGATSQAKTLCEDYSWEDQTSGASPLVEDCEELYRTLGTGDKGDLNWTIGDIQSKLALYKTCYIGGQRAEHGTSSLGNEDLRTLIRKSIDTYRTKFPDGTERVGSKGKMKCGELDGDWVSWGIYHSPT
ncbi:putative necrosis-inducing factor-domain-containing protein [Cladorrhinum sp. PSN332]|nr:putative necrosis-inducing factor-domain-containing protein [Cladorrhinum sp. PSN332]